MRGNSIEKWDKLLSKEPAITQKEEKKKKKRERKKKVIYTYIYL